MQLKYFAAILATAGLSLAVPSPVSSSDSIIPLARRGCQIHDGNALADAIKAQDYDKILEAVKDRSSVELNVDLAEIYSERDAKDIEADLKAAFAGRHIEFKVGDQKEEAEELSKLNDKKNDDPNPHTGRSTVKPVVYYCGGPPFYGRLGYGCGLSTLFYSLGGYQPGLLSGLGLVVDGLGVALGVPFILK
ncbi:uncharacterized protein MYCFIDRAFT_212694 [Pseudocercospora fijiensis CIRAD86]|uniref:Uncharacterized protein n=1 Tax=Pseudocercospora fijiensis (strain CIRAD86) TaxID=383855 RepID=M2ZZ24_PSEFD|nr:uncharacterized protein MYCFIDRAFT_212694 [Pseudocercospora fijiensis CIRAD86]EME77396.1 hypothetical protein MYCFIDRAFT_212694 [Pseudocercospora fijiensis CIRAD86]